MNYKEKHYKEIKVKLEKRKARLRYLLFEANPLSDIIDGRKKAQEILEKHKGDYDTINKLIKPLADKEKQYFKLYEQTKDTDGKMTTELIEIESELQEINSELWRIERSKASSFT